MENTGFFDILKVVIVSGVFSTIGMILFLGLITQKNLPIKDLIISVGSIFTSQERTAYYIGLALVIIPGIVFAWLYNIIFINFGPIDSFGSTFLAGSVLGLFHGSFVSMLLVVGVAEHNKFERYRVHGFRIAVVYLFGHAVYGALVGLISGAMLYV